MTDAELIWAVYTQQAPADIRLCQTYGELTDEARAIWLAIAKRLLANGADLHTGGAASFDLSTTGGGNAA